VTYLYCEISRDYRNLYCSRVPWEITNQVARELHMPIYEQTYLTIGFIVRSQIQNVLWQHRSQLLANS
jgi:hypothetical protein